MIREPELLPNLALKKALPATFQNRGTALKLPIAFEAAQVGALQRLWSAHLNHLTAFRAKLRLPESFNDVVAEINAWLSKNGIDGVKS